MKYFIHILFSFAITVSGVHVCAQTPVIVKDYNDCTYGLQDAYGKWIAPAVYTSIEPFKNGYGIAIKGGKYGLLDIHGKEVIKTEWDKIEPACCYDSTSRKYTVSATLYEVKRDKHMGLLDVNGHYRLPVAFLEIGCFGGATCLVQKDIIHWSFFHMKDSTYTDVRTLTRPCYFNDTLYLISSSELSNDGYSHRVGLITIYGDTFMPPQYDEIKYQEGEFPCFEVTRDGKFGYYSPEGIMIWPPEFDFCDREDMNYRRPLIATFGYQRAYHNSFAGIMKANGDTLLPFIYDSIRAPLVYRSVFSGPRVWPARYKGKWGVVDTTGQWIIAPEYAAMWLLNDQHTPAFSRPWNSDFSNAVFALEKNGMWGCLDMNSDTILPFVYDTAWIASSGGMIFRSATDVIYVTCAYESNVMGIQYRTAQQWFHTQKNIDAHIDNRYREYACYLHPADTLLMERNTWGFGYISERWYTGFPDPEKVNFPYGIPLQPAYAVQVSHLEKVKSGTPGYATYTHPVERYGEIYNVVELVEYEPTGKTWLPDASSGFSDYIYFGRDSTGILSRSGKLIVPPDVYADSYRLITGSKEDVFVVVDRENKCGLVDTNGKVLLQTEWTRIEEGPGADTLWIAKTRRYPYDANCDDQWYLYSLKEKKILDGLQFVQRVYFSQSLAVADTRTGSGVIDRHTMQFVVPPVYFSVFALNEEQTLFAVAGCQEKYGIVNSSGTMLVDTIWENIYLTNFIATYNAKVDPGAAVFVLSNNDTSFVVFSSRNGAHRGDSSDYAALLMNAVQLTSRTDASYHGETYVYPYTHPQLVLPQNASAYPLWIQQWLFKQTFTGLGTKRDLSNYTGHPRNHCGCRYSYEGLYYSHGRGSDGQTPRFQLIHASDSTLSAMRTDYNLHRRSYAVPVRWSDHGYEFYNLFRFGDSTAYETLFTLFADTAWKNIVIDSVLNYLKGHPSINADCSRPQNIPLIYQNSFTFDTLGIYLYPSWQETTDEKPIDRVVVFIPWTGLRVHLRPEIEERIFEQE